MTAMEFRVMSPADRDEVRKLYYTYWEWDPLAMGLNMEIPRECKCFVDRALDEGLYNGLSMVAVDESTNEIVGFGVCVLATEDNDQNWMFPMEDKSCQKMIKQYAILDKLYEDLDLFKMYGVEQIGIVRGFVTDPKYRGRDLGTLLGFKWCQLLQECGIPLFVAETTSEFSRRICMKTGFSCLRIMNYASYIADGTLRMPTDSPHKIITLVAKQLDTVSLENMTAMEYRVRTLADSNKVRKSYYTYWEWDPLAMDLNMKVFPECKCFVDRAMDEAFHNGLPMVAVDKSTNEIVAFGVCVLATEDNDQNWMFPMEDKDCQKMIKQYQILDKLYESLDKMYGVEQIGIFRGL